MVTGRTKTLLQGALLAALSLVLIANCWKAGFTNYDDTVHVSGNPHLAARMADLLKPAPNSTYFPVTLLSYQLDHALFAGWMPGVLGSWAPGVRCMTLLYHVAAALILWRLLLRLRLSERAALFIALVFVAHPLACETVCWTSERKNALAGLFGFAALWAHLAGEARWWRVPLALALYVAALASKPSALGLLPVFALLELFGGAAGLSGAGPMCWRPARAWVAPAKRLALLILAAAAALIVNLRGHAGTVIPPPGGSVFTAALTDIEILARYLYNLFVPVQLSAVYFVDPVRIFWDGRVFGYGLLLAAIVAATVALAANRRRAAFGWLWFAAALGPNLNLIAIPHLMQDRFLYLSTPGVFLVLVEVAAGLCARLAGAEWRARPAPRLCCLTAASAYLVALAVFAVLRSGVWVSTLAVFEDAARKQPRASFAHFGLGNAYAQIWEDNRRDPRADQQRMEAIRRRWLQAWQDGVDNCPDYRRYTCYLTMALVVGEEFNRRWNVRLAERYWRLAAPPPREASDNPAVRALALGYLASLHLEKGRPEEAYRFGCDAVAACDEPPTRLVRARAAVKLGALLRRNGEEAAARQLIEQARQDATSVPVGSDIYGKAQELLRDPVFVNMGQ